MNDDEMNLGVRDIFPVGKSHSHCRIAIRAGVKEISPRADYLQHADRVIIAQPTMENRPHKIGSNKGTGRAASLCSTVLVVVLLLCSFAPAADAATVVFLTAGTTQWNNPGDFNASNNTIEAIGAGGSGASPGGGGAGGAYARRSNVSINFPATVQIGTGGSGSDSYFDATSTGSHTILAKTGSNGSLNATSTGGSAAESLGAVTFNGGGGGVSSNITSIGGSGGGGAGGPNGNGAFGAGLKPGGTTPAGGEGGGGADNGFPSVAATSSQGTAGGISGLGSSKGGSGGTSSVDPTSGTLGGGGGGGFGASTPSHCGIRRNADTDSSARRTAFR